MPGKDFYIPFENEGLFIVFSHPFIFIFSKALSPFSHKSSAVMQTSRPELHQPGHVSPGSDRMRHQRSSLSSRLMASPLEALAGIVLPPLNKLAFRPSRTLSSSLCQRPGPFHSLSPNSDAFQHILILSFCSGEKFGDSQRPESYLL